MRQGCNDDGVVLQSAYVEHDPVYAPHADDGMTRQEFAAECDINTILQRYEKTGVIDHVARGAPQYLDLTAMPQDLYGALEIVKEAERAFMTLPATVRREFDNDPLRFVAFAEDPANLAKLREWDLAPPAEPPAAVPPADGGEPPAAPAAKSGPE